MVRLILTRAAEQGSLFASEDGEARFTLSALPDSCQESAQKNPAHERNS
jgi:hypothetical protein